MLLSLDLTLGVMEEQQGEDDAVEEEEEEESFEERNGRTLGVAKNVVVGGVESINIVLLFGRCATQW